MSAVEEEFAKEVAGVVATVSENLRWRKKNLGLKLWEISVATGGMEIGGISRLINGQRDYQTVTLVKLSRAMGVEYADWFLPPAEFRRKYRTTPGPSIEVRVVKNRNRTPNVTKDSPFCKPLSAA